MRVLGLSTDPRWGAHARILGTWLQALAAEGDVVALACVPGSAMARGARAEWPRLSLRDVRADGWWRRTQSVREVVQALRPDAVLVCSGDDAAAAALAMGTRGPVVWRESAASRTERAGWRQRAALVRGTVRRMEAGQHTVYWPPPDAEDTASATGVLRLTPTGPVRADVFSAAPLPTAPLPTAPLPTAPLPAVSSPVASPSVTLLLPPKLDDEGRHALRVVGALHERQPSLQLTLVAEGGERGKAPSLQDARIHAAALGMAGALCVQSLDEWIAASPRGEDVLWVVDGGDAGTLALLDAMHRATPVVVPSKHQQADLVLPGVTGLHAPPVGHQVSPMDDGAQLLSDLARVLGDAEWRRGMGAAAQRHVHRVRAPRAILHGLRVMLDPTSSPLS
ncbi:glycosyltransferase [Gemmatimonas sp. UBA7669]|uniref:glycosyltransferase n=1 Tax=Gemmatimonas sp. UBA7669 TaxID=1946568 RepID=UPI0025C3334F|nr:hypothetical protein [Gemmatimonas sp. UBA7669]